MAARRWPRNLSRGDRHRRLRPSVNRLEAANIAASSQSHQPFKGKHTLDDVIAAQSDSSGDRSLVRVFGLKLGKVVIDAGHGGHDTGTIGPHGLMEKDLALDVALRLGKLISTRLGRGGGLYPFRRRVYTAGRAYQNRE